MDDYVQHGTFSSETEAIIILEIMKIRKWEEESQNYFQTPSPPPGNLRRFLTSWRGIVRGGIWDLKIRWVQGDCKWERKDF